MSRLYIGKGKMSRVRIFTEGEYISTPLDLEYTSVKNYNNVKLYLDGEKVVLLIEKTITEEVKIGK